MPLKNGHLTAKERKFADAYAMTGNQGFAAHKAGFAHFQGGNNALQRPAVQEEIRRVQVQKLFSEALPAAVNTLISIMQDEKAAAGARVQASKVVLDRTIGAQEGAQSKAPHEMSAEEIQAALADSKLKLAALESVKADRARPIIEAEPNGIFD